MFRILVDKYVYVLKIFIYTLLDFYHEKNFFELS